ncbi:hypothetical protein [Mesorhizobium sp. M4B.F.Ca.ET.058.02.1.1]|uniref:hypothetical protein n=1 Tax=Mesorhizobium sp. M4B.F.Ca.ET.058.02.1.1 TaxID=2493675 RepID=UPI000F755F4D|nr:hypothetical protein [Mesorhizobium sp. M4B.F.Ca.ET.058.02.1.1]AZO48051.1 hypothetical protein EJ073_09640 [Mesorhizobium sp. M4B.F.Ca.ET.058.02.1.1]
MELALLIWTRWIWPVLKISIPVPLFLVLALFLWWKVDKVSSIRHAVDKAVDSYTHVTELAAANATIAELKRQRQAGDDANFWLLARIAELQSKQLKDDDINEKKDIAYAQALKDAGRGCTLNDADIDGMRND